MTLYVPIILALLIVLAIPLAAYIDWRRRNALLDEIIRAIDDPRPQYPPVRNPGPLSDNVMALTRKQPEKL